MPSRALLHMAQPAETTMLSLAVLQCGAQLPQQLWEEPEPEPELEVPEAVFQASGLDLAQRQDDARTRAHHNMQPLTGSLQAEVSAAADHLEEHLAAAAQVVATNTVPTPCSWRAGLQSAFVSIVSRPPTVDPGDRSAVAELETAAWDQVLLRCGQIPISPGKKIRMDSTLAIRPRPPGSIIAMPTWTVAAVAAAPIIAAAWEAMEATVVAAKCAAPHRICRRHKWRLITSAAAVPSGALGRTPSWGVPPA